MESSLANHSPHCSELLILLTGKNQKGAQTQTEEEMTRYAQELQKHQVSSHSAGSKVAVAARLVTPLRSCPVSPGDEGNTLCSTQIPEDATSPQQPNWDTDRSLKELLCWRWEGLGCLHKTFQQPSSESCYQEMILSSSGLQPVWVE